jgi:hypothetical protein
MGSDSEDDDEKDNIYSQLEVRQDRKTEDGENFANSTGLQKLLCLCGLYYKTITIIIMTIISDATIWSITYDRN